MRLTLLHVQNVAGDAVREKAVIFLSNVPRFRLWQIIYKWKNVCLRNTIY